MRLFSRHPGFQQRNSKPQPQPATQQQHRRKRDAHVGMSMGKATHGDAHIQQRTLLVAASRRPAARGARRDPHARGPSSGRTVSGICPDMLEALAVLDRVEVRRLIGCGGQHHQRWRRRQRGKTIIKPDYGKDGSMRQGGQRLASAGLRRRDGGSGVGDVVVEVASAMAMAAALVAVVAVVAMPARSSRGSPACRHQRRHAGAPAPPSDSSRGTSGWLTPLQTCLF